MIRTILVFSLCTCAAVSTNAQTMTLSLSNNDFQVSNVFSNVDEFTILIEIDAPLAVGTFTNPDIVDVRYTVTGDLTPGTPSGFPAFALVRNISGTEFYAQGSSLNFEISPTAVLSDGVQMAELVGNGTVFTFNAREVGNGRFHPALLELNSDGTGSIRNSNNIVTEVPLQQVDFGAEYITDLMFDAGNTTLITAGGSAPPVRRGGSGAVSPAGFALMALLFACIAWSGKRAGRHAA